ncbi:MAG: PadR family transcriptional regulator, partial [Bacteroidota bacterium]
QPHRPRAAQPRDQVPFHAGRRDNNGILDPVHPDIQVTALIIFVTRKINTHGLMDLKLTNQELKILSVLENDEMYGYQIVKQMQGMILLGSLYNVMKQLERKDLVESKWGEQVAEGARRRYYKINGNGRRVLQQEREFLMTQWGYANVIAT